MRNAGRPRISPAVPSSGTSALAAADGPAAALAIVPDAIHGDSPAVSEQLAYALMGRVGDRSFSKPGEFKITCGRERAERLLSRLPGGAGAYTRLADAFWEAYGPAAARR